MGLFFFLFVVFVGVYISHHPLDFSSPFKLLIDFFLHLLPPRHHHHQHHVVSAVQTPDQTGFSWKLQDQKKPRVIPPPPPVTKHFSPTLPLAHLFHSSYPRVLQSVQRREELTHITHAVTGYLNVSRQATDTDWLLVLICTKHSIAVIFWFTLDS